MIDDKFLTAEELAERWHMNPGTLANWRIAGKGPKYLKLGNGQAHKVLYRLSDIIDYENKRMQGE